MLPWGTAGELRTPMLTLTMNQSKEFILNSLNTKYFQCVVLFLHLRIVFYQDNGSPNVILNIQ